MSDAGRPKPPPLPTRAGRAEPTLSETKKTELAFTALGLMNEQLQARIVHYKAELETSPELDAVTAQVVAQLRLMQSKAGSAETRLDPAELETRQIASFRGLLARLFSAESPFFGRVVTPVGRRVAKLFFESELHERTKGDNKGKTIHLAEQGIFYVLKRYERRLLAELEGFEYVTADVQHTTVELLKKIQHDLKVTFLSRRSPELTGVMGIYTTVLSEFLQSHLPPRIDEMAELTILAARTAHHPDSLAYKIRAEFFPEFRREWERLFVEQMVFFCGDALLSEIERSGGEFREETVKFFTDPHMFSEACEVLCEEIYEFLCLEGFIDLPLDFRVARERGT